MIRSGAAIVAVAVLALAGCGSGSATKPGLTAATNSTTSVTPTPSPAQDATAYADKIKGEVSSAVKVVTITENNDSNNLIGRPSGYTSAAVVYEKSVTCTDPGVACGATVEVWKSEAAAKARAAYIQGIMKSAPALGTEYDYIRGVALLRVAGEVKPSVAAKYNAAFGGAVSGA